VLSAKQESPIAPLQRMRVGYGYQCCFVRIATPLKNISASGYSVQQEHAARAGTHKMVALPLSRGQSVYGTPMPGAAEGTEAVPPLPLKQKIAMLLPHLDERARRLYLAAEARALGHGGVTEVAKLSGYSRATIQRGLDDLEEEPLPGDRTRRPGGGRRPLRETEPGLVDALKRLVDPGTRGDPMSPLLYSSKSTEHLAEALRTDALSPRSRPTESTTSDATRVGSTWAAITTDTSAFAVASIRTWWDSLGRESYPEAKKLLICADGGGSNGSRVRLWKAELAKFAAETGLTVTVCHLPPGTSKWNHAYSVGSQMPVPNFLE